MIGRIQRAVSINIKILGYLQNVSRFSRGSPFSLFLGITVKRICSCADYGCSSYPRTNGNVPFKRSGQFNRRDLSRQLLESPNLVHTAAKLSTLSTGTEGLSLGPSGKPTIRLMMAATRIMHSQSKAWFSLRLRAHL